MMDYEINPPVPECCSVIGCDCAIEPEPAPRPEVQAVPAWLRCTACDTTDNMIAICPACGSDALDIAY